MSVHDDLTNALIAGVLDFPAALSLPELSCVSNDDIAPAHRGLWKKILTLNENKDLTVTSLASVSAAEGYDLIYLNKLRRDYSDNTIDDLQNIATSLRRLNAKNDLREIAGWLATESLNGREPQEIARDAVDRIEPYILTNSREIEPIGSDLSEDWTEIQKRSENPQLVWGIPYAWPYLSKMTGGKQPGELIILAGEPKVGKSYLALQDALFTAEGGTPTGYISLEMRNKQLRRRLRTLCGVNAYHEKTGYMSDNDWQALDSAMKRLENIPLYADDRPVKVEELRSIMTRLCGIGVQYFVIDYAYQVRAQGRTEIERTEIVSSEIKRITNDLNVSVMLITSVNKLGMDTNSSNVSKSNVRGSGQQIHDADMIYVLTKYNGDRALEMNIKPNDYWKYVMLHISAGRELMHHVEGGYILYQKDDSNPALVECKKPKDSEPDKDLVNNWQAYTE